MSLHFLVSLPLPLLQLVVDCLKINNTPSCSLTLKVGVLLTVFFIPYGKAVAQTKPLPTPKKNYTVNPKRGIKKHGFNRKTFSSRASFGFKKFKSYQTKPTSYPVAPVRSVSEMIHIKRLYKKQVKNKNFSQNYGFFDRFFTTSKKEKPFLKDIANRTLRTRQLHPKSPKPVYKHNTQNYKTVSGDIRSFAQWGAGWYAKWNRARIALTSNKGEKAWKGDISGRPIIRDNPILRATMSDKPIVLSKKNYIGSGSPNTSRHVIAIHVLKKRAKRFGDFSGYTKALRYQKSPHSHHDALVTRAPLRGAEHPSIFSGYTKAPRYQKSPHSHHNALVTRVPLRGTERLSIFSGYTKAPRYQKSPHSHHDALVTRAPLRSVERQGLFSGHIKISRPKRNAVGTFTSATSSFPNVEAEQFSGNTRIHQFTDPRLHPDAKFAHGFINNVKGERTFFISLKLFWERIFNQQGTQPPHLKDKLKKLHYDDGERKLWYR